MSNQTKALLEVEEVVLSKEKYDLWRDVLAAFYPNTETTRHQLREYDVRTMDVRYFINLELLAESKQDSNVIRLVAGKKVLKESPAEKSRAVVEESPRTKEDVLARDQARFDSLSPTKQEVFRFFFKNVKWTDRSTNRFAMKSLVNSPYTKVEIVDLLNQTFGYNLRAESSDITAPRYWRGLEV